MIDVEILSSVTADSYGLPCLGGRDLSLANPANYYVKYDPSIKYYLALPRFLSACLLHKTGSYLRVYVIVIPLSLQEALEGKEARVSAGADTHGRT